MQGKEHLLVTRNLVPGDSVYGEKRISIESPAASPDLPAEKIEYRVWNPFRSKLAAGILGGLDDIHIAPGKKVLYIGAASGTSVSHVADIVGPVRRPPAASSANRYVGGHRLRRRVFSPLRPRPHQHGQEAHERDSHHRGRASPQQVPHAHVDGRRHVRAQQTASPTDPRSFADVAQPDQARIVGLNAHHFLKAGGHAVISIKASCIDSTAPAEVVFAAEVKKMQEEMFKPHEQLTLGSSLPRCGSG